MKGRGGRGGSAGGRGRGGASAYGASAHRSRSLTPAAAVSAVAPAAAVEFDGHVGDEEPDLDEYDDFANGDGGDWGEDDDGDSDLTEDGDELGQVRLAACAAMQGVASVVGCHTLSIPLRPCG